MRRGCTVLAITAYLVLCGCSSPPAEATAEAEDLTVGKVQGEIKEGLDAARVAQILGSPNIITTDDQRREVWIYDKVSTDRVDTSKSVGGSIIILGGGKASTTSKSTQRTLTIIIKFDEQKRVRDFAYNYTQF
jgi:outer membrane protein assembly factor BamE (lipoprotein component of BamABCDE complex)